MAIAKKCDRCGKLYEEYHLAEDGKINGVMTVRIDADIDWFREDLLDLCPECCETFNKWLKDPTMMVILPTSITGIKDVNWMKETSSGQYKITCNESFMKSFEEDG